MRLNLIDCMPDAFFNLFGEDIPRKIDPRDVKDLRTKLNNSAQRMIGHQFPKKSLRKVVDEYILLRGYEKFFYSNRQKHDLPQWVYMLKR